MSEHKPWWPKLKSLPFFTSSAEWEAQLGADDRIDLEEAEDEKKEANADGASSETAPKESGEH